MCKKNKMVIEKLKDMRDAELIRLLEKAWIKGKLKFFSKDNTISLSKDRISILYNGNSNNIALMAGIVRLRLNKRKISGKGIKRLNVIMKNINSFTLTNSEYKNLTSKHANSVINTFLKSLNEIDASYGEKYIEYTLPRYPKTIIYVEKTKCGSFNIGVFERDVNDIMQYKYIDGPIYHAFCRLLLIINHYIANN